jgi:hypothetical protein
METCINWVDDQAYFSSDEHWWRERILKLAKDHPEDIKILKYPEENDGCLYASIPKRWVKVVPPRKRDLTEEQLEELRERMRKAQAVRNANLLKKQAEEIDDEFDLDEEVGDEE